LGKFRKGLFDDTEEFGADESWVSGPLPIGWDARRAILRGGTPGGVWFDAGSIAVCGDGARGAGDGALGAGLCGSLNPIGRRRPGVSPVDFFGLPVFGPEMVSGAGIADGGLFVVMKPKPLSRTAMALDFPPGRPFNTRGAGLLTCRPRGMGICSATSITCDRAMLSLAVDGVDSADICA
jgi:hypothetical protein